jgi:imidazole glycerol-phosphate synthase subunit HisH
LSVLIVDYDLSNLGSIRRALEECGVSPVVSDDPGRLKTASRIVLPGVGSFADGMANIGRMGWAPALREAVREDHVPLLGICLGMQLLAEKGDEGGAVEGLGLIPGEVRRFVPEDSSTRIPHVGWNEVWQAPGNRIFEGVPDGSDFYFVHSYHFIPRRKEHILATTPFCGDFVSAIGLGSVLGVQFHPEKSGRPGFQILKNFLKV